MNATGLAPGNDQRPGTSTSGRCPAAVKDRVIGTGPGPTQYASPGAVAPTSPRRSSHPKTWVMAVGRRTVPAIHRPCCVRRPSASEAAGVQLWRRRSLRKSLWSPPGAVTSTAGDRRAARRLRVRARRPPSPTASVTVPPRMSPLTGTIGNDRWFSQGRRRTRRTRTPSGHWWRNDPARRRTVRHRFTTCGTSTPLASIAAGCDVVTVQRSLGHRRPRRPQHVRPSLADAGGPEEGRGVDHVRIARRARRSTRPRIGRAQRESSPAW